MESEVTSLWVLVMVLNTDRSSLLPMAGVKVGVWGEEERETCRLEFVGETSEGLMREELDKLSLTLLDTAMLFS